MQQKISKYMQLAQSNHFVIIDTTQEQAAIDALLFAELSKLAEHVH